MDITGSIKGNIENIIDDAAMIKFIKTFIHFHSGFVVKIIPSIVHLMLPTSQQVLFIV